MFPQPATVVEEEYVLAPVEDERVRGWRLEQLDRLGLEHSWSMLLSDLGVDWHDAERLIRRGCPPALVLEILV